MKRKMEVRKRKRKDTTSKQDLRRQIGRLGRMLRKEKAATARLRMRLEAQQMADRLRDQVIQDLLIMGTIFSSMLTVGDVQSEGKLIDEFRDVAERLGVKNDWLSEAVPEILELGTKMHNRSTAPIILAFVISLLKEDD